MTAMSDAEIARTTRANIETIRFARGVNNHMGSRATADRRVMTTSRRVSEGDVFHRFQDDRQLRGRLGGGTKCA